MKKQDQPTDGDQRLISEIAAAERNPDALVRIEVIAAVHSFSKPYIFKLVQRGKLPRPIKFGSRCARWRMGDVTEAMVRLKEAAAA